jgi:hypothetical protein
MIEPPKIKCRFYPNCTNISCPYFHPVTLCPFLPNCKFGPTCIYIHPIVPPPIVNIPSIANIPCKYGEKCLNTSCGFSHTPVNMISSRGRGGPFRGEIMSRGRGRGLAITSPILCKFGVSCLNPSCTYTHPDRPIHTNQVFINPAFDENINFNEDIQVKHLSSTLPSTPPRDEQVTL